MRKSNGWAYIAGSVMLGLIVLAFYLFTVCYGEHRELGFTVWTSVMSCSG